MKGEREVLEVILCKSKEITEGFRWIEFKLTENNFHLKFPMEFTIQQVLR